MKRLLWAAELLIIIAITLPFALLPLRTGKVLGLMLYYFWRRRREIAIENVRRACSSGVITGTPEEIVRKNFEELGQSVIEIVKIYFGRGKGILDNISFKGLENIEKAKNKGRGIIFITGHCGNWELLALATSLKLTPVSVVARRLNNPFLNNLIERLRSRYGNTVIYKKGALKEIIKTLRKNGSVGILIDQAVLPEEGIIVDFLGRPAWTTKMPVLIARKTGSPILPVFIKRNDKGQEITIYPEVMLLSNN
ncbi:MAG: lysophospholipid acyltransferase family protein, partial [Thermodesulfovibrionales bacterium]